MKRETTLWGWESNSQALVFQAWTVCLRSERNIIGLGELVLIYNPTSRNPYILVALHTQLGVFLDARIDYTQLLSLSACRSDASKGHTAADVYVS